MKAYIRDAGGEDTYPVDTTRGETVELTRPMVLDLLDSLVPRGLDWLVRGLEERGIRMHDFERACRHFRLAHHVFDVPPEVSIAERNARRARGAPPTARRLPHLMTEADRELADAMLDVYERRVERVASYLRERNLIS